MPEFHFDVPDDLGGLFPNPKPGADRNDPGVWMLMPMKARRGDTTAPSRPPPPPERCDLSPARARRAFLRHGVLREIIVGAERYALRDRKGHRYIERLLRDPGTPIAAIALCAAENGQDVRVFAGTRGAITTAESLGELRERAAELQEELPEARRPGNAARQEAIMRELAWIADTIREGTALGGALRTNDDAERVRVTVTKAVHRAIWAIGQHAPAVADYFRRSVVTGTWLLFRPLGDERWELEV